MLLPSIFGENLFDDDWMNFPFDRDFWGTRNALYGKHAKNMMKTDVRETDTSYEVDIDLPGFKKEEISAQLENGYLTVSDEVKQEDVKAKYEDGILKLTIPKKEAKPEVETKKHISIEG